MTRPMPRDQRRALVDQYRGRRQALAEAAHAYITFYETHEGYAIEWHRWSEADARQATQSPYYGEFTTLPQCICDEDFLAEMLWRMVSQTPLEPTP